MLVHLKGVTLEISLMIWYMGFCFFLLLLIMQFYFLLASQYWFKEILFMCLFKRQRYTYTAREERERDVPATGWVPTWLQQPVLGQTKARNMAFHRDFPSSGMGPSTGAIFTYSLRRVSRELHCKTNSWGLKPLIIWDSGVPGGNLTLASKENF